MGGAAYDDIEWIYPPGTDKAMTVEQARRVRAHYAGLCELIDRWFGKLREAVQEEGLLDDTIFVFLSDHGTMLGAASGILFGLPDISIKALPGIVGHDGVLVPHTPRPRRACPGT